MATTSEYIVVVINGIIAVVTVVGGLLTILTIWTRPVLRKLVNVPLASLSCADILFATFSSSFWIPQILQPQWKPPGALRWFVAYVSPVLWGVSVCHMLCIALQRYFKICTNNTRLKSMRVLIIILLLTWLVPIVSFLPLYVVEEVKLDAKMKRYALGNSDNLSAKIPPVVLSLILPHIAALAFYILIQNHVRKSKKRVQVNTHGHSAHAAVMDTQGEGGSASDAGPSTSTETCKVVKPLRNLEGVVWEENPSGIKPGKPQSSMILVATAPGRDHQNQQAKQLSSDEELNSNDRIDPDKAQGITLTAASVSDQTGRTGRQQHAFVNSCAQNCNSAAERQITKMMMMLFAVYTICCIPITVMVIFSSKVPSEAFMVGQLLGSLNGALNPIIYGVMNKNIRQGYKHIWDRVLNFIT